MKPKQIQTITFTSNALWDEGRGYFSSQRITVYPNERITVERIHEYSGSLAADIPLPPDTFTEYPMTANEFRKIVKILNRNRFLALPNDCSDYNTCDGSAFYIEITTDNGIYRKGGHNPSSRRFRNCYDSPAAIIQNTTH